MLTPSDWAHYCIYSMKLGDSEVDLYDDGDIIMHTAFGTDIHMTIEELRAYLELANEYLKLRKAARNDNQCS